MNNFGLRSLLIVVVLFSTFQDGLCRKCYQCDSFNPGKYCGEFYSVNTSDPDVSIKECAPSEDYCLTQGIDVDDVVRVKRDCFNLSECAKRIGTVITTCQVCQGDLCNGNSSSINLPSIILGIVGFILVRFYININ